MGQNADAIIVAGDGDGHIAPVGSTLPANITEVTSGLDAAFQTLGFISEDGATFRDERTKEPINVWQSRYAVKYRVTDATAEVEFTLKQWDRITIPLAFGGGTITDVAGLGDGSQGFKYTPPAEDEIDERAFVLTWQYDQANFALVVPKVMVRGSVESQLSDAQESDLPLTLGIMGTAGADPWYMLSDHPAWDPAGVV